MDHSVSLSHEGYAESLRTTVDGRMSKMRRFECELNRVRFRDLWFWFNRLPSDDARAYYDFAETWIGLLCLDRTEVRWYQMLMLHPKHKGLKLIFLTLP